VWGARKERYRAGQAHRDHTGLAERGSAVQREEPLHHGLAGVARAIAALDEDLRGQRVHPGDGVAEPVFVARLVQVDQVRD
jgi:hypothetical protein